MNRIFLAGVLMLLGLSSCEDFFQTYMQVPPPPYKEGIVVNLYVYDDDTLLIASVSRNTSSLGPMVKLRDLLLQDASVQILDEAGNVIVEMDTMEVDSMVYYDTVFIGDGNGEIVDTFVYPRNPFWEMVNFRALLPAPFGRNGEKFTLQVSQPDLGVVTAVQTMPSKPVITHPVVKLKAGSDDYGGDYATLRFDIVDPPEENYYQVKIWFVEPDGRRINIGPETDDPLFEYSYDYNALLVQDKTFNGESYTVNLKMYYYLGGVDQENIQVFVGVQSVSKDYYLYARSLERASEMQDVSFFVEPVRVYNNIAGGYGIFAMNACTVALASKE